MKARKLIFRIQLLLLLQLMCSFTMASIQLIDQRRQRKITTVKKTKIVPTIINDERSAVIVAEEDDLVAPANFFKCISCREDRGGFIAL